MTQKTIKTFTGYVPMRESGKRTIDYCRYYSRRMAIQDVSSRKRPGYKRVRITVIVEEL